ncbi:MAG: 6-phosphogluconolactonase [Gemmatimonadaceae bacterium]|nr:6-phosphogluconolactonase [Gemmatimonadaceae bacterium]
MTGAAREVLTLEAAAFADRTARVIEDAIQTAVAARGVCRIVLAGGRTPAHVYRVLAARDGIPWNQVEVFIGDERCVPPTHVDSNFRMIADTLLDRVPIPAAQIHRLRGEVDGEMAADEYQSLLDPLPEPKFDFVLTGIGADGHTASLFPGDARVTTETAWAMTAISPPEFAVRERVGLSMRALCSSRVVCVLCTGAEKHPVRTAILSGEARAQSLPAALIHGTERTLWIVDPL